jgi:hypothetical protein
MKIRASTFLLTLLAAAPAPAQDRDARENEAKKACLSGKADRGIELLAEMYAETNDPTYIYNQGRCFEQNGRAPEALTRFREYLRKSPNMAAEDKAQVQAHITEMEEQARQSAPRAPSGVSGAGANTAGTAPAITTASAVPPSDSGHDLRVAGIATASVGVALVAGGIFFGVQTKSLETEITNDAKTGHFSQSKYDEGQRDQLLQWIGYGVGVAALASGGLLYFFGVKRGTTEAGTVTAMPELLPGGGAGGSVRVIF